MEYKWESSTGLTIDKKGEKEKTCKISTKEKGQWGKEHSIKCKITFYEKPDPNYENKKKEQKLVDIAEEHKAVTPLLVIKEISFNHDSNSGTKDALNLKKEFTDPQSIQAPEYKSDDHGNVTKNEPFLYVAGTKSTIKAVPSIKPNILKKGKLKTKPKDPENGITPVENLLSELKEQAFDLSGSNKETEFELEQPVDDSIAKAPQNWTWRLTNLEDTALKTENVSYTSKSVDSYIVLNIPENSLWDQKMVRKQPWCKALDFSLKNCSAIGFSKAEEDSIIILITDTIFSSVPFSYDTARGASSYCPTYEILLLNDFINDVENGTPNIETNCYAQNNTLTALTTLLGITVTSVFYDNFGQLHPIGLVGIAGPVNNPFYRSPSCPLTLFGIQNVPKNHIHFPYRTGFGNHLFTSKPEATLTPKVYDACGGPCYGQPFDAYLQSTIEKMYPNGNLRIVNLQLF